MAWTTSFAFIIRALLLFGIMICGAVVLGALLMANKDVSGAKKKGSCDCSLTLRGSDHVGDKQFYCGNSPPCNFVIFTAATYLAFGAVFSIFAIVNICRGTVEKSKFMLVESLIAGLGVLVVLSCGIMTSVEFQQLCSTATTMYSTTNCNQVLNDYLDAYWDRLTAVEGALWAMTAMLALLFVIGLPRTVAALRAAKAEKKPSSEVGEYNQFDQNTSGPV